MNWFIVRGGGSKHRLFPLLCDDGVLAGSEFRVVCRRCFCRLLGFGGTPLFGRDDEREGFGLRGIVGGDGEGDGGAGGGGWCGGRNGGRRVV